MDTNAISGLLLIIVAGSFSGTFTVPFKGNKKWQWENNWFIWSFVALLIVPWIISCATVPNLISVYKAETDNVWLVAFFGLIWGIGAILFGKGIDYLGISLGLPIMLGLINSVGTIMPIVFRAPKELLTPTGLKIILGVLIILIGVVLFALAGHKKEEKQSGADHKTTKSRFKKGLIICLLAGIFGPMINFAFFFGAPLQEKAIELGCSSLYSANVVWSIALSAGFIINVFECLHLFRKNQSWKCYKTSKISGVLLASLAGILWYFSIMFYGMGQSFLGALGVSIGWATMQSMAILAGNVAGIISGEWKGVSHQSIRIMIFGLLFLIVGMIVVAY